VTEAQRVSHFLGQFATAGEANTEATKETEEVTEQLIWGTNEYLAGLKIASSGPFSSHFVTFSVPS